jgi:serine/threonine protein kinase
MGVVHLALDEVLQREVALKELPHDLCVTPGQVERLRHEARVLARLAHPSIVHVHDLIERDGRTWIALEYVRGGTLAEAMQAAGGALPWMEVARLGRQLAEGLAYAHAQGVIHRDLKPMNVLLTDDEPPLAKLTDFGLARMAAASTRTQAGTLMGSVRYMSPEQASGAPVDERSDLYSFGVMLFEMLAGQVPFEGEIPAVIAQHLHAPPPDLGRRVPGAPAGMVAVVAALLAKDPGERPAGAGDVARELETLGARAA